MNLTYRFPGIRSGKLASFLTLRVSGLEDPQTSEKLVLPSRNSENELSVGVPWFPGGVGLCHLPTAVFERPGSSDRKGMTDAESNIAMEHDTISDVGVLGQDTQPTLDAYVARCDTTSEIPCSPRFEVTVYKTDASFCKSRVLIRSSIEAAERPWTVARRSIASSRRDKSSLFVYPSRDRPPLSELCQPPPIQSLFSPPWTRTLLDSHLQTHSGWVFKAYCHF